jgi:lipopolysaccharide biosynthesis protein
MQGASKVAAAIHVHYADIFDDLLAAINDAPACMSLFVTTTNGAADAVHRSLKYYKGTSEVEIVENRGRDVLPFLRTLPKVKRAGYELVAKVHTKRSPQLKNGDKWRREMVLALLGRQNLGRILGAFNQDPSLGIVGPDRQYVSLSRYLGANQIGVADIATRLGLSPARMSELGFFAGTMFIARMKAMEPIMALGLSGGDFPPEKGQMDGTLAHILERCMTFGAVAQNMRVANERSLDMAAIPHAELEYVRRKRRFSALLKAIQRW